MNFKVTFTFSSLLFSMLLMSCQIQGNKATTKQDEVGISELRGQTLSDLKRVCDALRTKRHFLFEIADREKRAELNVRKRDCGDPQEYDLGNFTAEVRKTGNLPAYLEPITARSRYLQDIVTDMDGDISHFCLSAYSSDPQSKIELADRTLELQVVFEGSYDKYIIKKNSIDPFGKPNYEIEEGAVHTIRTDSNEDLRGILKQRVYRKPCPSGQEEYFTQTFLQLL